jgi:putative endonuclease
VTDSIFWIYILNCENNSYYTGYTTDLMRRFQEHLLGTAKCKYTRSFKPLNIAQFWQVNGDKALALKIERYIKRLTKDRKTALILHPDKLRKHFALT